MNTPLRLGAVALLLAGVACAGNKTGDETTSMAKDTTTMQDTSAYTSGARDTMAGADKASGMDHADTNQTMAPNSTSENPTTEMPTDSMPSSGQVRADTNQSTTTPN